VTPGRMPRIRSAGGRAGAGVGGYSGCGGQPAHSSDERPDRNAVRECREYAGPSFGSRPAAGRCSACGRDGSACRSRNRPAARRRATAHAAMTSLLIVDAAQAGRASSRYRPPPRNSTAVLSGSRPRGRISQKRRIRFERPPAPACVPHEAMLRTVWRHARVLDLFAGHRGPVLRNHRHRCQDPCRRAPRARASRSSEPQHCRSARGRLTLPPEPGAGPSGHHGGRSAPGLLGGGTGVRGATGPEPGLGPARPRRTRPRVRRARRRRRDLPLTPAAVPQPTSTPATQRGGPSTMLPYRSETSG
jgi:hypothetical protein